MKEKTRIKTIVTLLIIVLAVTFLLSYKYFYLNYIDYLSQKSKVINKNVKFSSPIPIVVIDATDKVINGEKVKAKMDIYNNLEIENSITRDSNINSNIEIKVSSESSKDTSKQQYLIDIKDNKGSPKDIEVLGMKSDSQWILDGAYGDKSLIRNYLVYNLSSKIMDYAPSVRFCEVFVKTSKGEGVTMKDYKGLYIMTESIKVSKNRIDISSSMKDVGITSYIVSRNKLREKDSPLSTYTMGIEKENPLICIYPDKVTDSQLKYIEKDIDSIEKRMYSMMYADPKYGYRNYIDVNSFIDYVIINEFFFNAGSGNLNTYFYKEPGGKLKAGPVWNFNISSGNFDIGGNHSYLRMRDDPWFEKLLTDQYFLDSMARRYKNLRRTYLSEKHVLKSIDSTVNQISPFMERNQDGYKEEINIMKSFIKDHGRWMDKYFETGDYLELTDTKRMGS